MDFKKFSKLIMIEQTLFALPFGYIGLLFAGGGIPSTWIWVTTAMIGARTAGMSFNRVIDAKIDGANPRTENRLIPSGEVKPIEVWILAIVSSALLIFSSYMLNELCFHLSFAAVFLLFTYSYFKRFSASSHFYLGFVEAAAPIGGFLAVTGKISLTPFLIGAIILTWIAGLDIVYSLQDKDFDTDEGLHSIPVKLGKKNSLILSGFCYFISIGLCIITGIATGMSIPYWISIGLISIIFIYQQRLAWSENISDAVKKFFKANMFISPLLLLGTFLDWILK